MFWDVAFAPDGTKLATASWDKTVIIWDFTSKQLARPFPLRHDAPVYCVAFSEDGQRLATGSSNGTVCLWNLDEKKISKSFPIACGPVSRVSFRPDGKALAAASWNYKARVWDLEGRPKSEILEGVCALAFSRDGCLATGSVEGFIRLWNEDGKEYKEVQEVKAHADSRICHISFDANGQQLATVSWDGTAKLWNLGFDLRLMSSLNDVSGIPTEGKNLIIVAAVNNVLHFRIFDGDGKVVVDTDEKRLTGQARQIEDLKKQLESLWPPHELTTSDKGRAITAVTSIVGYTRNLQKPEGTLSVVQPPEIVRLTKHVIYRVAITADRKLMTTASSDGAAHQWDLDRQRAKFAKCQIIRSKVDKVRFFGTSFSPDGQVLATASSDNIARLWNLEGNELPSLKGHCGPVFRVNFSGNGEYLVTASADRTARLWKRDGDGKSVKEFSHSMSVYCACFSPDGDRVATASEDGFVCIWDLEGNKIHQFPHPGPVYYAWFSPHGEWLATASADGLVRLWNPQERPSQQPLKRTRGNKCPVFCVSFRHDGKQLASVSGDGYMRLWDLPDNRRGRLALQTEFRVHPGLVFGVSYAPDSRWLATSSYDGSVRLWSAEGKQLAEFKEHIGPVYSVAVSCDGKKLATSSFDGSVIVRQIVLDTSVLEELLRDCERCGAGSPRRTV